MDRRRFIQHGSAAVVATLAAGCVGTSQTNSSQVASLNNFSTQTLSPIGSKIAPLQSSFDRVTRSIVGLRPFRPTGPRLETQKIGNKHIVHNYGHGGGGVSLSWGVAELASKLVKQHGDNEVAVLGSGVIGLSSALELQRAGADVTIYAKDFPPYTTSNVAGAMWHPVTLFERNLVSDATMNMLHLASKIAFKRFIAYSNDPRYGVFWIRQHGLSYKPMNTTRPYIGGDALYPGMVRNQSNAPFKVPYYDAYYTLMIDPDIYLRALVQDFRNAGGKLKEMSFSDQHDIDGLSQNSIVNCLGLGAGAVFDDKSIIPTRGQLSFLLPQANIDYGYAMMHPDYDLLYSFPRRTGILLGGSVDKGNWDLSVDEKEVQRMVKGHAHLASLA